MILSGCAGSLLFSDDERAMIGIVLDTEHHAATIMWAPDMRVLREGVGDVEVFDETG